MKKYSRKTLMRTSGLIVLIVALCVCFILFRSPLGTSKSVYLKIYPGQSYDKVLSQLKDIGSIRNSGTLELLLTLVDYKNHVHPGLYTFEPGTSGLQIVRRLRSGLQTPVQLTFNNVRTVEELAGRFSHQLMADSTTLLQCFRDSSWRDSLNLTESNYVCIFIPDTYEVWWNVSPEKLRAKFVKAWHNFWNDERLEEASSIGLTPAQVSTLASIVEEETKKTDEMPKVAGLYLNRLRIDMPLQADPTVKFAVGDFTLHRILLEHISVRSPYNTYLNTGLPPGPIRIPSVNALQATLKPTKHSYIYMCAKDDFSGYHAFATTFKQHQENAVKYRQALNVRGIMR
jgi:UPF0755 protein